MDFAVSVCEVQCDIIDYAFSFCHTQQKIGRGRYQENQQDIGIDIDRYRYRYRYRYRCRYHNRIYFFNNKIIYIKRFIIRNWLT